jgi:hypothetical protein
MDHEYTPQGQTIKQHFSLHVLGRPQDAVRHKLLQKKLGTLRVAN